jgi:hypothetical protein
MSVHWQYRTFQLSNSTIKTVRAASGIGGEGSIESTF